MDKLEIDVDNKFAIPVPGSSTGRPPATTESESVTSELE